LCKQDSLCLRENLCISVVSFLYEMRDWLKMPGVRLALLFCIITASPVIAFSQPVQKVPAADKIIDGYLKAIGGKKKAAAIQDAVYEYAVIADAPAATAKIQIKAPGSYRSELNLEKGQVISSANQRSAWVLQIETGLRTLTGPDAGAAKLQAVLDAAHLADYKKSNVTARAIGVDNSFPEPAYAVEFSSRTGARVKYFFSTASKLLVGIQDDARKMTIALSDYRPEGQILEPHTVVIKQNQAKDIVLKLQRVVYNSGITQAAFDPPRSAEALDVMALLREVSRNQDAIEKRFSEYSFLRKQTDREIDSKGVLKKETVRIFEVFPLPNRRPVFKLISENGVTLSGERAEKEDKRVQEEFLKAERDKEKDAQKAEERKAQREREKAKQKEQDEDVEISQFFRNCEFISPRREKFQGRDSIVFDFRAKPGFKPRTRPETLIAKLVGVVWIDPEDKQVIRLEARLADGYKIAGGLLVSLRPGAALVWEQTRLKEGIWMPLFAQLNLSIKLLLFGGGDINQTVEWSDYKHFSSDVDSYKLGQPKTGDSPEKKP